MYGIYANIWGILMVNVTIYSIHGSYGIYIPMDIYMLFPQGREFLQISSARAPVCFCGTSCWIASHISWAPETCALGEGMDFGSIPRVKSGNTWKHHIKKRIKWDLVEVNF